MWPKTIVYIDVISFAGIDDHLCTLMTLTANEIWTLVLPSFTTVFLIPPDNFDITGLQCPQYWQ